MLPAKSSSGSQEAPSAGGVHGGDGSEVGGKTERLHPLYGSRGVEEVPARVGPGVEFPPLLWKGLRPDGLGTAGQDCGRQEGGGRGGRAA